MGDSLTTVENLLERIKEQPELIGFFLVELLESDVLVLRHSDSDGCTKVDSPCGDFLAKHCDGTDLARLSFFSSPEALIRALVASGSCFAMNAEELFKGTRGSYLQLNPGQDLCMEFPSAFVEEVV
jgi:hypothetical protein